MRASFTAVNRVIPVGRDVLQMLFSKYLTISHMRLILLAKLGRYQPCAGIANTFAECNLLQQLKEMNIRTNDMCNIAAAAGHLEVIIWATNYTWHDIMLKDVGQHAAEAGHLHILEWLGRRFAGCSRGVAKSAARGGHLHILKWMKNNYIIGSQTSLEAAKHGHLNIISWLADNQLLDINAISYAARYGHLDIVQWAYDNGCSLRGVVKMATKYRHQNIINFIQEKVA